MNNTNTEIQLLFPTPVFFKNINTEITKEELDHLDYIEKNESHLNSGNKTSTNTYILNLDIFKNLKDIINGYILHYFYNVLDINKGIKPYITQSWLNFTDEERFHHIHTHSNSVVSGVYYFNADIDSDNITFYREMYEQIKLNRDSFNSFNSNAWTFNVKTGDLILFPSNLGHGVNVKKGKNKRISLAFNTFIKGEIGEKNYLNMLSL
jgi:uncharacterized protein (TIGR02466 family)